MSARLEKAWGGSSGGATGLHRGLQHEERTGRRCSHSRRDHLATCQRQGDSWHRHAKGRQRMSDHFSIEATRRTLMKAMAGGALAGPLLGSMPGRAHAAPTEPDSRRCRSSRPTASRRRSWPRSRPPTRSRRGWARWSSSTGCPARRPCRPSTTTSTSCAGWRSSSTPCPAPRSLPCGRDCAASVSRTTPSFSSRTGWTPPRSSSPGTPRASIAWGS